VSEPRKRRPKRGRGGPNPLAFSDRPGWMAALL